MLAWHFFGTRFNVHFLCDFSCHGYQMCELTIVGMAFLWHQIRCIVSVLFLVGQGKEKSEVSTSIVLTSNWVALSNQCENVERSFVILTLWFAFTPLGFKTRIGPLIPMRIIKGDWNGAVSWNNHKKVGPMSMLGRAL